MTSWYLHPFPILVNKQLQFVCHKILQRNQTGKFIWKHNFFFSYKSLAARRTYKKSIPFVNKRNSLLVE